MKLKTKLPETDLADLLTGIGALTHTSYRSVLAALGCDEKDLPQDLPGDPAGVHLLLWGAESISLPAAVQRELARLTRARISDWASEQLLREVAARQGVAEEQRRKEHVDKFIASELEFSYRGGLPDADVSACYRDWCGSTGESPLDDITSRIPSWANSFRSWVPPAERMLRESRIREFIGEACRTFNQNALLRNITHLPAGDLSGAYSEWAKGQGLDADCDVPALMKAIGFEVVNNGREREYRGLELKPRESWGPTKPPVECFTVAQPDPYATNQRTPGAIWSSALGRWVLPGYLEAVERKQAEQFEAILRADNKAIAETRAKQEEFDRAHPQPESDPNQRKMFLNSYSQATPER